jgi:hypothetical protein
LQEFSDFEELLYSINYEEESICDVALQTKTYNLKESRLNDINNVAYPLEFGVLTSESGH